MIRANCKRVVEPPKKGPLPRSWQKPVALVVGIAVLIMWLMEGAAMTQYVQMTNDLDKMNQDIANLVESNAALEQEIHLVRNDPFTLEKLARERLGYVREGEVVYQLVEAE